MSSDARHTQMKMDFDRAERRSVLELWGVGEIYEEANGDLLERLYEDTRIERKASGFRADEMAVYMCMWANTSPDGGLIAIGVQDDGKIIGCQDKGEDLVRYETRAMTDLVPDARVESKRIQVRTFSGEVDFVHLIRVHYRDDRVVETNKEEAWIRRGNTKHLLTGEEKRELRLERGQVNFELEPCGLDWPTDFDMAAIEAWVGGVYKFKNIPRGFEPHHQVLVRHRLGKIVRGVFAPNNACTLLFAKDPQTVVPGCMLRFQRIDGTVLGTGKDRNVVKNVEIVGSIPQIVMQSFNLIESQLREYSQLNKEGRFIPVPEYPREAWQEAIVNACVHRSYSLRGSNIVVSATPLA